MKTYIVLIFIYIVLLIINYISNINLYKKMQMEYFTNNDVNQVDFYVISLKSLDRLLNIETQNKKLNAKINIIDAVNGININQHDLLEAKILSLDFYDMGNIKRSKEIGCYMSHDKIFNLIKNNTEKKRYSIILEDDFNVIPDDIIQKLNNIIISIDTLDFDILFLGNTFNNTGLNIKDNIYSVDKTKYTMGTFAYLINNANIDKLIGLIKPIDSPIDNKFDTLIKNDKLKSLVVYPNIINYMIEIPSNII
jgi:GR25 family glycosyltransferase involved in LPS biosynthesis